MKITNIKNNQKEIFIKNLEKGLMATEGVYADNWFNRKKGRVGMTYAQAQAMEDMQNSMKKEKTPGSNRHTLKYGGVGTSTMNAAQKAGFSDNDILKEKKVGENGYSMTLRGDIPIEKLEPVMEALRKEYGKNIEFEKDIDKNGNTIFTAERTVKKTLMHKIDEGIDKLKGKVSKIKGKDKTTPFNTGYGRRVPAPSQAKTAKEYMHSLIELSKRNDFNSKGRKILGETTSSKGEKIITFDIMGFSSKNGERFTIGMGENNKFYKVGLGKSKNIEEINKKELSNLLSSREGTENMSNLSEELGIHLDDTAINFNTKDLKEKINPFQ